ncbi:energy transducer TonB [Psychroserpens sp. BH13MA-6]
MKDFKKSHDIAGQSNKSVQKSQKHDANLQKNSSLYFQIGLILCLLATYGMFEMQFETKQLADATLKPLEPENNTFVMPTFVVEPEAPKVEPVKRVRQQVITPKIKIVKDDVVIPPVDLVPTPTPVSDPVKPSVVDTPKAPEDDDLKKPFNLGEVEIVPIYPGCEDEKSNAGRIKCMNEKIGKLIQRKFDTDLASELGLSGRQKINVQFKINEKGEIVEILSRAPHPSLEREAKRVTNKIPQMKPGLQQHKPVSVIYNLPIVFQVK